MLHIHGQLHCLHTCTFGPLQISQWPDTAKLRDSTAVAAQQGSGEPASQQSQLSDTQAALRHALQQLDALTDSSNDMRDVHAKLEQQSQALQTMQETFDAVETEKAQEHEQTLSRSVVH